MRIMKTKINTSILLVMLLAISAIVAGIPTANATDITTYTFLA